MKKQAKRNKKLVVGLTGTFGSGKSTVAGMFKALGAKIVDADSIAHEVINPGTRVYKNIVGIFSRDILGKNNRIDRCKLAKIVFKNKGSLRRLEKIVHPAIIRDIKAGIKKIKSGIVVLDAPLLIEVGLADLADKLVVVKINQKEQISRIFKKTGLSRKHILERIKYQMPLKAKLALADFIIDNNGTIEKTRMQVKSVWRKLNLDP